MPSIKYLLDKYKIDKRINRDQLDYYYTNDIINCCQHAEKPVFDDIKPFDYLTPLHKLISYYDNDYIKNYYQQLLTRLEKHGLHNTLDTRDIIDKNQISDLDEMMVNYIKCRPNTFIITVWPLAKNINELIQFLQKNGNIYYIKEINLSYNACFNLVYQLYGDVHRLKTIKEMKEKLDYIGWGKENNIIKIIVFDNVKNLPISGGKAPFKEEIRQIFNKKYPDKRGDDFVHINDKFYQTIEYAQIYFHINSLKFLDKQDLIRHLNFKKSRLYLQTFKKWFVDNISLIDRDRFIIFGGCVLYTHGIRENRDIDGLIVAYNTNLRTPNFKEKVIKNLFQKNTRFFFLDFGMPNSEAWKESWTEKNKEWYSLMGVNSLEQMIYDRKYYYYYQGMKFLCLKYELLRRILRKKISDYADLIASHLVVKNSVLTLPAFNDSDKTEILKYMKEKYPELFEEQKIRELLKNK